MTKFATAGGAAVAALLLTSAASAETLKMQTFLGANASTTKAFEEMAAGLKEATAGEVDIEVLPGGSV
ncbi:MAG: hypothetical protein ACTS3R_02460, partial [Inquilinaceae bacterium]